MSDEKAQSPSEAIKGLLKRAELSVENFQDLWNRPMTEEEFYYLLGQYPYVMLGADLTIPDLQTRKPSIIRAKNAWPIFDYGDVLLSAGNPYLSLSAKQQALENGEEDDGEGTGTIIQQFTDIAFLLIDMIAERNWTFVYLAEGYYPMLRMAWIAAERKGLRVEGFEATATDYVIARWVNLIQDQEFYPTPGFKPGLKTSPSGPGKKRR